MNVQVILQVNHWQLMEAGLRGIRFSLISHSNFLYFAYNSSRQIIFTFLDVGLLLASNILQIHRKDEPNIFWQFYILLAIYLHCILPYVQPFCTLDNLGTRW